MTVMTCASCAGEPFTNLTNVTMATRAVFNPVSGSVTVPSDGNAASYASSKKTGAAVTFEPCAPALPADSAAVMAVISQIIREIFIYCSFTVGKPERGPGVAHLNILCGLCVVLCQRHRDKG